jgi:hypothetical protein
LLHGRIELDKIVIAVQGLESHVGIIHWLAPSIGRSGAQYPLAGTTKLVAMECSISIGWHHQVGHNGVANIHWLVPPSTSRSGKKKNRTYSRLQE